MWCVPWKVLVGELGEGFVGERRWGGGGLQCTHCPADVGLLAELLGSVRCLLVGWLGRCACCGGVLCCWSQEVQLGFLVHPSQSGVSQREVDWAGFALRCVCTDLHQELPDEEIVCESQVGFVFRDVGDQLQRVSAFRLGERESQS